MTLKARNDENDANRRILTWVQDPSAKLWERNGRHPLDRRKHLSYHHPRGKSRRRRRLNRRNKCRVFFQTTVFADAMLRAELKRFGFDGRIGWIFTFFQNSVPIWFPHCPTCKQMISRGISNQSTRISGFSNCTIEKSIEP